MRPQLWRWIRHLLLALWFAPGSAAAASFLVPVSGDSHGWIAAAALAGLQPVRVGPADVVLVAEGTRWTLRVRDERGEVRAIPVAGPRTQAEREDLLFLAASFTASIRTHELPWPARGAPSAAPPVVRRDAAPSPTPPPAPLAPPAPEVPPPLAPPPAAVVSAPAPEVPPPPALPPPPVAAALPPAAIAPSPPPPVDATLAAVPSVTALAPPPPPRRGSLWLGLGLATPTLDSPLGLVEVGGAWTFSRLEVELSGWGESASPIDALGGGAETRRVGVAAGVRAPAGAWRLGLSGTVAAHVFSEDGEALGARWVPGAAARVGRTVPLSASVVVFPWVAVSAELLRVEAGRDGATAELAPVGARLGASVELR